MKTNKVYLPDIVGKGYRDFWKSRCRYRVCKGSRGSKKSKTTALNMIYRLFEYPESNALCVRRYGNTLRDSMFSDLKWAIHRFGLDGCFTCTLSPLQITRNDTGQKILFRGLDDGMKITSISVDKGVLNFVWIEEAFEICEDDFNKLDMSIRGQLPDGYFKQITLTFNPWSATSWLKKRFFDEPADSVFTKTTTWQCNEWLSDDDRKIFLEMKENNPRRYRIEGEGDWGIAEGLIYENVIIDDFDADKLRTDPDIKDAYGLDFGYVDPNAFVCLLIDNENMRIFVFDEWYQRGGTNQQIARTLIEKGYGSRRIVCDCAEPKSINELCREGIKAVPSVKGRDSVNYGIQRIQNYKIIVHPKCENFKKEILNYCWAKDKNGNPLDKPDHEFSHGMDAMRYAVNSIVKGGGLKAGIRL